MECLRRLPLTCARRKLRLISPRVILMMTVATFITVYSILTIKTAVHAIYYPQDQMAMQPRKYTIQPGQDSDEVGIERIVALNNFSNHKYIEAAEDRIPVLNRHQNLIFKDKQPIDVGGTSNNQTRERQVTPHTKSLFPKISLNEIKIQENIDKKEDGSGKCERIVCRQGVCFENLNCIGLPPFLPDFKNPCFLEKVDPENDSDQNAFENYIIRRMVADPNIAPVQHFHKQWQTRRRRAIESNDGYQLRCLPYFFIIGMEKCGTTDIYQRIALHPDIILSPAKELQWWTRRRFFYHTGGNKFPPKLQSDKFKLSHMQSLKNVPFKHYYSFFDLVADQINMSSVITDDGTMYHNSITGDGSPNTMYWNDFASLYGPNHIDGGKQLVAHHIASVLPKARIIAILRNPTDRLYSSYMFFNKLGSKEKFHQIVTDGIQMFEDCLMRSSLNDCVYDPTLKEDMGSTVNLMQGLYSTLLEDWYKVFPKSQIHVVNFESYKKSELTEVNKIFRFLHRREIFADESIGKQISTRHVALEGKHHDASGEMFPKTRIILENFYRPHNIKLAQLLNDDVYLSWNNFKANSELV